MAIITCVRLGAISHQDSLGNQGRTQARDVQVMSAGTGIRHSKYNLEPPPQHVIPNLDPPKSTGPTTLMG
ncbi:MAG: redox-sensitive bicupin YhaK (pirin superfamily) [Pseudomonas sp.]|jgi:redox-sensitive bicupin YhaK (pirin superfamily)